MPNFVQTNPTQIRLIPMGLDELITEDHLARRFKYLIEGSDLSRFESKYNNFENGRPAIPPAILLAIITYAYATGVQSSRVIEEKCKTDHAFMFLAQFLEPDHATIARFRAMNAEALENLFAQTVALGVDSELISFEELALDGTKIQSMGSRCQFVNTDKLETKYEKCKLIIKEILAAPEEQEAAASKRAARKLRKLENKLKNIAAARQRLGEYESKPKRVHLTEPDTRLMKDNGTYDAMYNAQAVVDGKTQMIVQQHVTQNENDIKEGPIAFDALVSEFGSALAGTKVLADVGYLTDEFIQKDKVGGIDLLISIGAQAAPGSSKPAVGRQFMTYNAKADAYECKMGKTLRFTHIKNKKERNGSIGQYRVYQTSGCQDCQFKKECFLKRARKWEKRTLIDKAIDPAVAERKQNYRNKMEASANRKAYKRRSAIVEPVFGLITSHRNGDKFRVWGLKRVSGEWALHCIVHNMLKLMKYAQIGHRVAV